MFIKANSIPHGNTSLPLADESVDCIVTSPPYWGLRRYGSSPEEFGCGSLGEYLSDWLRLSSELWRVLKRDGTFWLNIGDCAIGSGGAGGDHNKSGAKSHIPKYKQGDSWLRRHQWGNIPAILTTSMQMEPAPGTQDAKKTPMWLLRSEIIWDKSPKVERCAGDHVRRPKVSHEKIYMFAKSDDYKFYFDRLVEPGSVWHFDPNRTGDKGYAPFPDELAYRCIMPSTDIGDVVLDPFSGSGTTVYVAESNCRTGIGLELYL